jgi:Ca2+-binding RTX toxin-like protein
MIETLENRTLLTAVLSPAGVLTVNGLPGAANDNILVSNATVGTSQFIRVQHFNHAENQLFPASKVNLIVVNGFAGNDLLRLLPDVAKNAVLNGHDGNDILIGGKGNDRLLGGNGTDNMNGMAGNDSLDGGFGADNMFGGLGVDSTTYASRSAGVIVTIDNVANDGQVGEGDNVHTDIEVLFGGRGSDSLTGSASANRIFGGAGNDRITGGGGSDSLLGQDGNDIFFARDGVKDFVDGGLGIDVLGSSDVGLDTIMNVP